VSELLHELVRSGAAKAPDATALRHRGAGMTYGELADAVSRFAAGLCRLGVGKSERVAIYLPKCFEAVVAMFVPVTEEERGEAPTVILRFTPAR